MNDTHPNNIEDGWSTGLDSYADNIETRQQKFALVSAALNVVEEENESREAQNAVKQHLIQYQEVIENGINSDCIKPAWTYSTFRIRAYLGLVPSWRFPRP